MNIPGKLDLIIIIKAAIVGAVLSAMPARLLLFVALAVGIEAAVIAMFHGAITEAIYSQAVLDRLKGIQK